MSIEQFYTQIRKELSFIHQTRLDSLLTVSKALITGGKLSITQLGNNIDNNASTKHNIKKVDRLLGNKNLEVGAIYSKLSCMLLSKMKEATILVDWCIYKNKKYHVLQASLIAEGRSLPLYRDVYDINSGHFHQTRAENKFLINLKKCIPDNITKVVIVTDAGFNTPWFSQVRKLGWHFVGRLRGILTVNLYGDSIWKTANQLFTKAGKKPRFLGAAKIGKSTFKKYAIVAGVHAYHASPKNRESINKRYNKSINELYKSGNKEPLIIITSSRELDHNPQAVIKIYQKRMQIEQNFRDDKNNRWGFGFRLTRCSNANRLAIYLLLSTIAQIFLWLLGCAAEQCGLQKMFQVNTLKRRVLSYISLGKLIVNKLQDNKIGRNFIKEGILYISAINAEVFI